MSVEAALQPKESLRFLTTAQVMKKLGIRSRSTLLKYRQFDDFPKPRRRGGEILCWLEHEIHGWMEQQPIAW